MLAAADSLSTTIDFIPIDVLEKGIDISRRVGSVIHCLGVLIHVHNEQRQSARQTMGMVGCPVVMDFIVSYFASTAKSSK
jgi:hypothetical protein